MQKENLNVLLVDDDALMLRALSKTLKRLCNNAEITCVETVEQLESYLNKTNTFDIVFCDSAQSAISGLKVLPQIRLLHPTALRCLFTSDLAHNYELQINNTIHFHLVKPFTQSHLTQAVNSAELLRSLPINLNNRKKLGQLNGLPFLSAVTQNLLSELNKTDPSINILEQNIVNDPLLSSKLLQVANSAYMGFDTQTTNIKDAIIRIGLISLRAIVVFSELSAQIPSSANQKTLTKVIKKSDKKAHMAKSLAQFLGLSRQEQLLAYATGLLSVIGELASLANEKNSDVKSVPEYTLSAYLLALWGFEETIVRAQMLNEPIDHNTISLSFIHSVVEHAYCFNSFDFEHTEHALLDGSISLEEIQLWWQSYN
ncbi:hypothetical protein PESP_a1088 [Pseudoalteromonas espejiana DSM 9414]|uniref:Response regulator n=1 Tax=Pseudoalteromonas espejiana TaxID=28107 RepID=A0A510XVS9_9GAMM|nr:HDOD domain-containing protein [Pseudoalteromonas espejiana]ASM49248.1 hypothetical protein PESP_a1088 [Pseudoalteromonas espejiana DSM 9414]GEK55108.1 response regulator [Pseudoalteromonas espejiana]